jgi:hypothetical protein
MRSPETETEQELTAESDNESQGSGEQLIRGHHLRLGGIGSDHFAEKDSVTDDRNGDKDTRVHGTGMNGQAQDINKDPGERNGQQGTHDVVRFHLKDEAIPFSRSADVSVLARLILLLPTLHNPYVAEHGGKDNDTGPKAPNERKYYDGSRRLFEHGFVPERLRQNVLREQGRQRTRAKVKYLEAQEPSR